MSLDHCDGMVRVAEHVVASGKNPCKNTHHSLSEALMVVDCCRQKLRCELASRLLDLVETQPLGKSGDIAMRVTTQRDMILNGVTIATADGAVSHPASAPQQTAPLPVDPGPPIVIRGWNFAWAMARWTSAGCPMRTQAEIDERLAICQSCEHLVNQACNKCGCFCVQTNQVMNKLALATEVCPEGKWK